MDPQTLVDSTALVQDHSSITVVPIVFEPTLVVALRFNELAQSLADACILLKLPFVGGCLLVSKFADLKLLLQIFGQISRARPRVERAEFSQNIGDRKFWNLILLRLKNNFGGLRQRCDHFFRQLLIDYLDQVTSVRLEDPLHLLELFLMPFGDLQERVCHRLLGALHSTLYLRPQILDQLPLLPFE